MYSERELREAINELASEEAPALNTAKAPVSGHAQVVMFDDAPSHETRRRARTRLLLVGSAATLVAAGCLAFVGVTTRQSHSPQAGASSAPTAVSSSSPVDSDPRTSPSPYERFGCVPTTKALTIGTVSQFTLGPTGFQCPSFDFQSLDYGPGYWVGEIVHYAQGAFDTSLISNAQSVNKNGITGYLIEIPGSPNSIPVDCTAMPPPADDGQPLPPGWQDTATCQTLPGLAWQGSDGTWNVIVRDPGDQTVKAFGSDPVAAETLIASSVPG